jgi:hypothetical protein
MEWMATITGDHAGYPGFGDLGDLGDFLQKMGKNLGEQKFAHLSASNFCSRIETFVFSLL